MQPKISTQLESYINFQFPRMVNRSEKLEQEREKDRKRRERERKSRKRQLDKKLKSISHIQDELGNLYDEIVNKIEQSYDNEKKAMLRKEGDTKQNPLKSKDTVDLNNFLYICYRHIRNENPQSKDMDIYKWLAKFLEQKEYRIKGRTNCDWDIIKERIATYKTMSSESIVAIDSLIDRSYKGFLSETSLQNKN